jgi:DNA-directed RNA polymerase subunit RPC12/RpoP
MLYSAASERGGSMRIELSCAKCGGNHFDYPLVLTDDAEITCADCGHEIGTVADLQRKVVAQLNEQKPS